eukprot:5146-Heterococcus_DN1.PRE.1
MLCYIHVIPNSSAPALRLVLSDAQLCRAWLCITTAAQPAPLKAAVLHSCARVLGAPPVLSPSLPPLTEDAHE